MFMSLDDIYSSFQESVKESENRLVEELAKLRTGRVTPDLVNNIQVECYGSVTPLNGLASINNSDARTLVISPWDQGAIEAINKSLSGADLGVQPVVDGNVIRLVFPSLTEEMREQTIKQLHSRAEEAKVRLRQERDEALKKIKNEKEGGDLTEDDFYDGKKKLDEMIDEANKEIASIVEKKELEIKEV
jgi:ribosome recycling factor